MAYQKLGLIGAMVEEVELIHKHLTQTRSVERAGITFTEGDLFGKTVIVCKSGYGKVNAAVTTQILIDSFQADAVIFTGVAGAIDPELDVGDIVISDDCLQHDVDVTALGYPRGIIPFLETSVFQADETLKGLAYEAGQKLFQGRVRLGRILSGDQFIADSAVVAKLKEELHGTCTEMEGAAVAQVCSMNKVPFVVIRSMSDKADGSAHVSFAEFTVQAAKNSYRIVEEIIKRL